MEDGKAGRGSEVGGKAMTHKGEIDGEGRGGKVILERKEMRGRTG